MCKVRCRGASPTRPTTSAVLAEELTLQMTILSRGGASTATPLRSADWDIMQFHSFPVRAMQTVSPGRRPWMRVILRYIQATRTLVLCPNMVAGRRMGRCCFPRPLGRTELRHALFRGQGLKLLDVSLTKDTKISERLSGQFRFEVFNVLNKTQYTPTVNGNAASRSNPLLGSSRATPDVQISNPSVGSGAARSIQLGFKLQF